MKEIVPNSGNRRCRIYRLRGLPAARRQLGGTVINVDKLTYAANLRSLDAVVDNPRYIFEQADICDRRGLDAIFSSYQPTGVIHLAAESHVDRSISGPDAFLRQI